MTRIGVIADDLTGSGDAGIFFLKFGTPIITGLDAARPKSHPIWIIDTESRFDRPDRAARKVRQACRMLLRWGAQKIYKKVDSALRGPMGAELDAVLRETGVGEIPLVLAYPAMGRTVRKGVCLIHGVPVARTAFGKDPKNPVRSSHIPTAIRAHNPQEAQVKVCDATSPKDLDRIARKFQNHFAAAGSAGFAQALVKRWHFGTRRKMRLPKPKRSDVMVVSGSGHEQTWKQLDRLKNSSFEVRIVSAQRERALPERVMQGLMKAVRHSLEQEPCSRFVAAGGDTAARLCRLLGLKKLNLAGHAGNGMAHVWEKDFHLVLKPGGLGDRDSLTRCVKYLKNL